MLMVMMPTRSLVPGIAEQKAEIWFGHRASSKRSQLEEFK